MNEDSKTTQGGKTYSIPWHRRIQFRVSIIVITTLALVLGTLGCLQFIKIKNEVNDRLMETADLVSSRLSSNLSRSVYSLAPESAVQIIFAEMKNKSISAIHVHEKEGLNTREDLFAGYTRDMHMHWRIVPMTSHPDKSKDLQNLKSDFVVIRDILYPEDGQDKVIGQVEVYMTRKFAGASIRQAAMALIFSTILVVVLIGAGLLYLLRLVTQPIINLTKVSTEIAKGNFDYRVEVNAKDEFGILADSFVQMGISIKQQIHSLKTENAERLRAEAELEQSRQQLQAIIDNTTAVIYLKDVNARYIFVNRQYENLFHISKTEIAGKGDHDIFPSEVAEAFIKNDQKVMVTNTPLEVEEKVSHDDGIHTYISVKFPMYDTLGSIRGVCGISTDISDRKQAENLLKNYSRELEQTVESRTHELTIARDHAEQANRAKSALLANMSHELRTPLNAIIGFSELMTRDASLSQEQLKDVETIVRSGEHLLSLINDVLEFSKIEAGRIVLRQDDFDLHQLLLGLKEMFQLRIKQKGLYLNLEQGNDVPQCIRADQSKLSQILINLLGNASKFTEKGGIILRVTCSEGKPAQSNTCSLCFEVADTGAGIAADEQAKVFDAFFQTGFQKTALQGTGLGLPISQRFVSMMGGRLELDSEPGRGAKFSFAIPVELVKDADIVLPQLRPRVIGVQAGQTPFRLLVVEDNDNSRNLLVRLLENVGFDVQEAINGRDAIEVWQKWQPHLIWMDMRMPVMDGYQATRHISGAPGGDNTVIIALTASAFEEDRKKIIADGGQDFVRKPFREAEIFAMLETHLGVKFVYEQEDVNDSPQSGHGIPMEDLQSGVAALPADILAKLVEATELSDSEMIDQVIQAIRIENNALANALADLAEDFAYDAILDIAQRGRE